MPAYNRTLLTWGSLSEFDDIDNYFQEQLDVEVQYGHSEYIYHCVSYKESIRRRGHNVALHTLEKIRSLKYNSLVLITTVDAPGCGRAVNIITH